MSESLTQDFCSYLRRRNSCIEFPNLVGMFFMPTESTVSTKTKHYHIHAKTGTMFAPNGMVNNAVDLNPGNNIHYAAG